MLNDMLNDVLNDMTGRAALLSYCNAHEVILCVGLGGSMLHSFRTIEDCYGRRKAGYWNYTGSSSHSAALVRVCDAAGRF